MIYYIYIYVCKGIVLGWKMDIGITKQQNYVIHPASTKRSKLCTMLVTKPIDQQIYVGGFDPSPKIVAIWGSSYAPGGFLRKSVNCMRRRSARGALHIDQAATVEAIRHLLRSLQT